MTEPDAETQPNVMIGYPAYAFCMDQAARAGAALGYTELTGIEFGVAGGNGLLAMEHIAGSLETVHGVRWHLYGFDNGTGLPEPQDYRDLPYAWAAGSFCMDEAALRARLTRAVLRIGPIKDMALDDPIPTIGFVAFDLDYHSSTVDAIGMLQGNPERLMPRTYCYFDDVVGGHGEVHCDYVGELAAIREFNMVHVRRKLCPINGLSGKLSRYELWHEGVRVLHLFDHPDYCRNARGDQQLPLMREGT